MRASDVEVKAGLLPVKMHTGADGRELDRAKFLIASLQRCWRGGAPFDLHVVGLDAEVETLRSELARAQGASPRVCIEVHAESEFFADAPEFFQCSGTYKQQLIKLFAPPALRLGPFITFDADIVSLRPFDEKTFVRDGRLISQWEARKHHAWWENSMSAAGIWADLEPWGLGVTPNVLHSDLCAKIGAYFALRNLPAVQTLCKFANHHPFLKTYEHEKGSALTWSEYSLYTLIAEWFGVLFDYHLRPEEVGQTGVALHSIASVWGGHSADRLTQYRDHPGYFVIVQSWAKVPIEEVAQRLGLPLV